jgi:hypothetical protein
MVSTGILKRACKMRTHRKKVNIPNTHTHRKKNTKTAFLMNTAQNWKTKFDIKINNLNDKGNYAFPCTYNKKFPQLNFFLYTHS